MRRFCRPHNAIAGMRCLRAERDNTAAAAEARPAVGGVFPCRAGRAFWDTAARVLAAAQIGRRRLRNSRAARSAHVNVKKCALVDGSSGGERQGPNHWPRHMRSVRSTEATRRM